MAGPFLLDLSSRGRLRLTGPERREFLQGLVSNDVSGLAPGSGVEALLLTPKGRLVAPLAIFALEASWLVDLPGELGPSIARKLAMYKLRREVEVEDVTAEGALLHLCGDGDCAAEVLAAAGGEPPGPESLASRVTRLADTEAVAGRVDRVGFPGIDLLVPVEAAERVRLALRRAGGREIDGDVAEGYRIRAGVPRWGREMDENLLPPEIPALVPRTISYTKGCYVGQETIARIQTYGHVNRELRRLALETTGEGPPAAGTELFDGDARVGSLTSVGSDPDTGGSIALGFVRRGHFDAGTTLRFGAGEGRATIR